MQNPIARGVLIANERGFSEHGTPMYTQCGAFFITDSFNQSASPLVPLVLRSKEHDCTTYYFYLFTGAQLCACSCAVKESEPDVDR